MLTLDFIATAPPGRHLDSNGLYLEVSPKTGKKRWVLRYSRPDGSGVSEKALGLLEFTPLVTARMLAYDFRVRLQAKNKSQMEVPDAKAKAGAYGANYNAQQLGLEGTHTAEEFTTVCEKQNWKCNNPFCCNPDIKGTGNNGVVKAYRDHIIPKKNGGRNDITNIQALCAGCNTGKGNQDWIDFLIKEAERVKRQRLAVKFFG